MSRVGRRRRTRAVCVKEGGSVMQVSWVTGLLHHNREEENKLTEGGGRGIDVEH